MVATFARFRTVVMAWNKALFILAVVYLILRYGFIALINVAYEPRDFMNPVAATIDRDTKRITLVRETPRGQDLDWLVVTASRTVEARKYGEEFETCQGPSGVSEYERIDANPQTGAPANTLTFGAPWIAPCLSDFYDTSYAVRYFVTLSAKEDDWRSWFPDVTFLRPIDFIVNFPAPALKQLEDTVIEQRQQIDSLQNDVQQFKRTIISK